MTSPMDGSVYLIHNNRERMRLRIIVPKKGEKRRRKNGKHVLYSRYTRGTVSLFLFLSFYKKYKRKKYATLSNTCARANTECAV